MASELKVKGSLKLHKVKDAGSRSSTQTISRDEIQFHMPGSKAKDPQGG
jgi:hypothetical protein